MPPTDRKLELKAKTSMAQTGSQAAVYAKGLINQRKKKYISVQGLEYADICWKCIEK
jgi:hypothetical protein